MWTIDMSVAFSGVIFYWSIYFLLFKKWLMSLWVINELKKWCWWSWGISVIGRNWKGCRCHVGPVLHASRYKEVWSSGWDFVQGMVNLLSQTSSGVWELQQFFTLFQTWRAELCCSVTLFHALCSDTAFVYPGNILGLKQQTLTDQIWKEKLTKELWQNGAEDAITQAVRKIVSVNYMILVFAGDEGKRINDPKYSHSGTY